MYGFPGHKNPYTLVGCQMLSHDLDTHLGLVDLKGKFSFRECNSNNRKYFMRAVEVKFSEKMAMFAWEVDADKRSKRFGTSCTYGAL